MNLTVMSARELQKFSLQDLRWSIVVVMWLCVGMPKMACCLPILVMVLSRPTGAFSFILISHDNVVTHTICTIATYIMFFRNITSSAEIRHECNTALSQPAIHIERSKVLSGVELPESCEDGYQCDGCEYATNVAWARVRETLTWWLIGGCRHGWFCSLRSRKGLRSLTNINLWCGGVEEDESTSGCGNGNHTLFALNITGNGFNVEISCEATIGLGGVSECLQGIEE